MKALLSAVGALVPIAVVVLIIAGAMAATGRDNTCTAAGGHLEFAAHWPGDECVRNGKVIAP